MNLHRILRPNANIALIVTLRGLLAEPMVVSIWLIRIEVGDLLCTCAGNKHKIIDGCSLKRISNNRRQAFMSCP